MSHADKKVRHHLLEIILWPNKDGTFKLINNSVKKLQELNIYKQFKLTIEITFSEHGALHGKFSKNNPRFTGHKHTELARQKMSIAYTGKKRSEETKIKMKQPKSDIHKKHMSDAWKLRRQIPVSEETKARMRAAWARRKERRQNELENFLDIYRH